LLGEGVGGLAVEAWRGGIWWLGEGGECEQGKNEQLQEQPQVLRLALRAALRMTICFFEKKNHADLTSRALRRVGWTK
jgi:hypothetical protein